MTREMFDIFIDEMERLTMVVCPPATREEYWLKYKDAEFINVQETIFNGPIKIKDFPITRNEFEEIFKIIEDELKAKIPDSVQEQIWDDYSHLTSKEFKKRIIPILIKAGENDSQ